MSKTKKTKGWVLACLLILSQITLFAEPWCSAETVCPNGGTVSCSGWDCYANLGGVTCITGDPMQIIVRDCGDMPSPR